ncbi:MAG: hypothetical protein QN203_03940 [Armatimonadota bacterium]|nr:hypothetical protein [Armatimonadota bacterium]MDR7531951.1 hypothetical protein [Armatimonadota bacterium]
MSYQGDDYALVGFYFAGNLNGHRELFYILRLLNGYEGDRWPR